MSFGLSTTIAKPSTGALGDSLEDFFKSWLLMNEMNFYVITVFHTFNLSEKRLVPFIGDRPQVLSD
jgi:hypothetical protein